MTDEFVKLKGLYQGADVKLSHMVSDDMIDEVINHWNTLMSIKASERRLPRNRMAYRNISKYDWYDLSNEIISEMVLERIRPLTSSDYIVDLYNYLKSKGISHDMPINYSNFVSIHYSNIIKLSDLTEKMYETFNGESITLKQQSIIPPSVQPRAGIPSWFQTLLRALGAKVGSAFYNLIGAKEILKSINSFEI
jgi:hypothetical protein